jgi:hypothetical protein
MVLADHSDGAWLRLDPAFIIPLTIAGETAKLEYAGVGYAFIMSLSNVTNMFEGVVGAALYQLFTRPWMSWLVAAFGGSPWISRIPPTSGH